jgi:GTP pyrophosphokinase
MELAPLLARVREYLPADKIPIIEAAYAFAAKKHAGQKRVSGEPYLEHPVAVAMSVAELQLDAATVAAALLHDVQEDCAVPNSEIAEKFGPEVAKLVDSATKLAKVSWKVPVATQATPGQAPAAENLRRLLLAMAEDVRVVFIKLADRLHNMKTLGALPEERQQAISRETLEIFAPLAHRLGMWQVKWQLEDMAFRHLEPDEYHRIARLVASRRAEREEIVDEAVERVKVELAKAGVRADVIGRPKHIYSIYKKIEKYATQGKDFGDIHDLLAVRILVDSVPDCYKVLGIVHGLWHPILEEFNDYIANTKENGYQSLHTTVLVQGTTPLELQIRTQTMHRVAEYGVAAHWRYKEDAAASGGEAGFESKIAWLRQLLDWQKELTTDEFLESVKTDLFIDQVFVFTPKGEIRALPKDATPLDFAYLIHTELGHRCIGAKVNGKLEPLNRKLNNGDVVEIMTTKGPKAPSFDWLNPNLGYVNTSHARTKVRQWFGKQERAQNIERGRMLLDKELKRLGLSSHKPEDVAKLFEFDNLDDFYQALGAGGISAGTVDLKLAVQDEPPPVIATSPADAPPSAPRRAATGIQVLGVGDLLTHMARCCTPVPGDEIMGYVTRTSGVTVHRKDCRNIIHAREPERLIQVDWGRVESVYPVPVQVHGWDRVGLLRDITSVLAEERVNITTVTVADHEDNTSTISLVMEIKGMPQLNRILSRIEGVRGVIGAARSGEHRVKAAGS